MAGIVTHHSFKENFIPGTQAVTQCSSPVRLYAFTPAQNQPHKTLTGVTAPIRRRFSTVVIYLNIYNTCSNTKS